MKTFSFVILTILFFSSCDPAAWQALADEIAKSQNVSQTNSSTNFTYVGTSSTFGCSKLRLRKSYIIEASKSENGIKTLKRYQAWTENYLMYLVEIDARGRTVKRYDGGGEPLADGLSFIAETRVELEHVYGADNRLKLENKVKIVPMFKYCSPWSAHIVYQ